MQVWSSPYVNVARSYLRRAGITRLLTSPVRARNELRKAWYGVTRPDRVEARLDGASARLLVSDATEFVRIMSFRDDRRILGAILGELRPGDVYWDVGASVGLYTTLTASRVGASGKVVAFEPEPRSNARLRENVAENQLANVRVMDTALGREAGTLDLHFAGHFTAGTHTLYATAGGPSSGAVQVKVARGDDLRKEEGLPTPNVIKVDVEGAEEEVIAGLSSTLAEPACRAVLCEVHFALLEARGHREAPSSIVSTLATLGFAHAKWIDSSHLFATK